MLDWRQQSTLAPPLPCVALSPCVSASSSVKWGGQQSLSLTRLNRVHACRAANTRPGTESALFKWYFYPGSCLTRHVIFYLSLLSSQPRLKEEKSEHWRRLEASPGSL